MIALTPEAAAFARAHGGCLTLRSTPRHGCCGGTVGVPVAEVGAPADPTAYRHVEAEGVPVFVAEALASGSWRIGLDRLFGLAALFVEPVDAPT